MPFKYSCYISYQRSQHQLVESFVEEIYEALTSELELHTDLPVFLDRDQIAPGQSWPRAISQALCESVCLLPVFTPTYFSRQNIYCAREYRAMELLERERVGMLPKGRRQTGLILPVVLRGASKLPKEIASRQFLDLSGYLLVKGELSSRPAYYSRINELAQRIAELGETFSGLTEDPCRDCGQFSLPGDAEVLQWVETLSPAKPSFPFASL